MAIHVDVISGFEIIQAEAELSRMQDHEIAESDRIALRTGGPLPGGHSRP